MNFSYKLLPDLKEIYKFWDKYNMLNNIRKHSYVVSLVGLLLTKWLSKFGFNLHKKAILSGTLLHDLAKTNCLNSNRKHNLEGQKILENEGYYELGYLVKYHIYAPIMCPLNEIIIINYADKRVNNDKIVSVKERFDYIFSRYGLNKKLLSEIEKNKQRTYRLEKMIFNSIKNVYLPNDIEKNINLKKISFLK